MIPSRSLWGALLLLVLPTLSYAQDFHYSQFYNAPLHLNPALTGVFNGDTRIMGNYKSQWTDVPVDYKTVTLAVDKRFLGVSQDNGYFAGGVAFNYDRAGDSRLTWANLDLNLSYTRAFSQQVVLTVGGKAAGIQRSFSEDNLRFDSQFSDARGRFDPELPNRESFDRDGNFFLDFSVGANLRLQQKQTSYLVFRNDRRSKLDIGVALHHLTAPDQNFYDDEAVPLERRLSPYAIGVFQIPNTALDLMGAITFQNQGSFYDETVGMAGLRYWVKNTLAKQVSVMAGMGLRRDSNQDAYWPTFEVTYDNWRVGLNYDFNTSRFDIATENRGGLELSVRYIIRKVRPLPQFKSCPII